VHDKAALEKILELKERADEDRYFAERDRELIAKLKHAHESEHENAIRDLARFRCPQCGVRLEQHPFHGVTIEVCRVCQGAWFSKEKLEALTQGTGQRWAKNFLTWLIYVMEPPPEGELPETGSVRSR
jgi:hypothetical protein